MRRMCL